MHLARVTGAVVSTQKSPSLVGKKLLLVRGSARMASSRPPTSGDEVAVDSVGAGSASWCCSAAAPAPARFFRPNEAIDLAVVGIVDTLSR
jgi:microcompartment protein CcmK/EutM